MLTSPTSLWKNYRAVIFDCDDTILATAKTRWNALIVTAAQFHVNLREATIRDAWGKPFDELIADLLPNVSFDTFLPAYQQIMRQFPPQPTLGAVDLLNRLQIYGVRMEIVTSSRQDLILQDLDAVGIEAFFANIWGHEQTAPYNKPDPRVLSPVLTQLEPFNIGRSLIVYVGDSVRDYAVAQGNEIDFIAVTSGLEGATAFHAAGVSETQIVSSLQELASIVTNAYSDH